MVQSYGPSSGDFCPEALEYAQSQDPWPTRARADLLLVNAPEGPNPGCSLLGVFGHRVCGAAYSQRRVIEYHPLREMGYVFWDYDGMKSETARASPDLANAATACTNGELLLETSLEWWRRNTLGVEARLRRVVLAQRGKEDCEDVCVPRLGRERQLVGSEGSRGFAPRRLFLCVRGPSSVYSSFGCRLLGTAPVSRTVSGSSAIMPSRCFGPLWRGGGLSIGYHLGAGCCKDLCDNAVLNAVHYGADEAHKVVVNTANLLHHPGLQPLGGEHAWGVGRSKGLIRWPRLVREYSAVELVAGQGPLEHGPLHGRRWDNLVREMWLIRVGCAEQAGCSPETSVRRAGRHGLQPRKSNDASYVGCYVRFRVREVVLKGRSCSR